MTNILMTGATGFIGSRLLDAFSCEKIRILGRSQPKFFMGEVVNKAINASEDYTDCFIDIDAVIHLAAVAHNNSSDLNFIKEVNVRGTLNLARQAAEAGVKRFVFISSIGVLGSHTEKPFCEQSPELPHSEYAQSKLDAEKELQELSKETGLEVVIVRPVLVYGKNAPGNFGLLSKFVSKLSFTPFLMVKNKRSFISVDNLCDFISLCIAHPKAADEVFLISDSGTVSTPEIMSAIAKGMGKSIRHLPIPVWVMRVFGKLLGKSKQVEQLVGDLEVDCSKAKNLLGWTPPETMAQAMAKFK
jgi:nucleoside-diphosphate-sugar epimerase